MIIGELVERLISIRDSHDLWLHEQETIEEACNLLDKLPRLEEATEYAPIKN